MKKNSFVLVGLFLATFGFKVVLLPLNVNIGGFAGVSQILNKLLAIPFGVSSIILNVGLFFWGAKHEGMQSVTRAIFATIAFSMLLDYIPTIELPMILINYQWLAIIVASICVGCGFGLILRGDATTGGSDYLGKILIHKFPRISMGMSCTLINLTIVAATAMLFGISDLLRAILATILVNESVNITLYVKSDNPLPATLQHIKNIYQIICSTLATTKRQAVLSTSAVPYTFVEGQIITLRAEGDTIITLQILSVVQS